MSTWAHDAAVQLFNEAKLAPDAAQKLHALQRLGELVFQKEPALLPHFGPALLELQADPAATVRRFLADKLEEIAAGCQQLLPACIAAAALLLRGEHGGVVKRALLSAVGLFRLALARVCALGNDADQAGAQAAWAAARALCTEACALASRAGNDGVRLQAIKFAEASALMFTTALGAPGVGPGIANGVAPVAASNTLVSLAELRECLQSSLDALSKQLEPSGAAPGPVAVVLVTALGAICRQRPHLIPDLLPTLLRVAADTAAAESSSQVASMVHALKSALLQLLRGGLVQAAFQDRTVAALGALGQQEAAVSAVRQVERSFKRERAAERELDAPGANDEFEPAPKRACADAADAPDATPATDPGLLLQVVSALAALASGGDLVTLNSFIAQLTPAVLADIVLLNMRHLPAAPPAVGAAGADVAVPGLMALFSAAASPAAAAQPPAPATVVAADTKGSLPSAHAAAAAAPPPLVAQQLGSESRAAQRLAAAERILRSDERKIVTASGGDTFRCAVLARVGADAGLHFRAELLDFLLEDYQGRQGHAHLIQWLYCVYAADMALPTPRARSYDEALLAAARGVLQRLSARDRALPLLFVDAPVLPAAAMGVLEWLVGLAELPDVEPASLEQRTLGLITLRDVVMHRKQERAACLALVLRCTVHADDALRGKAIRMVVNQLHPLPYAAAQIEQYAIERAESVPQLAGAPADEDAATADAEEALRRISLYFALCTRTDALLPRLFSVFAASNASTQPAFHRNMAGLARTLGADAPTLLRLIESPPPGSEALALQAFQALCDACETISAPLLQVGRSAYAATNQDARFLMPCLHVLPREDLRALLPQIVALSSEEVIAAFRRILEVPAGAQPVLSAPEIMVALHGIDPAKDGVPLKKVMDACAACFAPQLRDLFTPDALAVALQQLVECVPLPLLFMRTVIQTATVAPKLHGFILELLSKLVLKQVWRTDAKTWQGVLRCAKQMVPRSFPVYLQLPAPQLKEALAQFPDLAAPLALYAGTAAVRHTVPAATLEALGEHADE